jgi:hypothetical protein
MMMTRVSIALAVLLAASSALAEDCPTEIPEDAGQRRQLAKKWFARGESEARAGDDLASLKAYQCSLSFVPHGFTAYNVAQLAEKIGDLDLAIGSYEQYLTLVPEAKDAKEVGEHVVALKERLEKVRGGDKTANQAPLDNLMDKSKQESFPDPVTQRKTAAPNLTTVPGVSANSSRRGMSYRTIGYITAGSGAVLLGGGVLSNLLARGQMDTCRSEYQKPNNLSAAESACNNAKALAYLSYGLIGVGAAAVVTGAVLMFLPSKAEPDVAFDLLPEGGLALRYAGRF